jgi:hypothetical protein
MPQIAYKDIKFQRATLETIELVNGVIGQYKAQGYDLTLRQVYYQMVSRAYIPNNEREYKKLGEIISNGRLAGLIDWNSIEDRTRNLKGNGHWLNARQVIDTYADYFAIDKWAGQQFRVEVWVEKDALVGVIEAACSPLDVSYFSCRGYVSQTEMWIAAQRIARRQRFKDGPPTVIIHLGDHDPSGRDMSRDIEARLNLFGAFPIFHRVALNYDQVEQYGPPPNPTKLEDTRATAYIEEFGHECWELDALEPSVIEELVTDWVLKYRDEDEWEKRADSEQETKTFLKKAAKNWNQVTEFLGTLD